MLKVTTTVTYKIPHDEYCQFRHGGMCRFVAPNGMGVKCTLHDEPLQALHGNIYKCHGCVIGRGSVQNRIPDVDITVEPDVILRTAVNEYIKTYKSLRKKKYSETMAIALAKEQITESGW